jgi:hypothetical protein
MSAPVSLNEVEDEVLPDPRKLPVEVAIRRAVSRIVIESRARFAVVGCPRSQPLRAWI